MLPPDIEGRVAAVAADRTSGATELATRALEAFEVFCTAKRSAEEFAKLGGRAAVRLTEHGGRAKRRATMRPVNVYLDLTPPDLVTSCITDRGVYEPRRIGQLVML